MTDFQAKDFSLEFTLKCYGFVFFTVDRYIDWNFGLTRNLRVKSETMGMSKSSYGLSLFNLRLSTEFALADHLPPNLLVRHNLDKSLTFFKHWLGEPIGSKRLEPDVFRRMFIEVRTFLPDVPYADMLREMAQYAVIV
jgi:hypothetical protein